MKAAGATQARSAVVVLRALSDLTRLRIMSLLIRREMYVQELVGALGRGQSMISRHLASLQRARLVRSRKEGSKVYYRSTQRSDQLHTCLMEWLKEHAQSSEPFRSDLWRLKAE